MTLLCSFKTLKAVKLLKVCWSNSGQYTFSQNYKKNFDLSIKIENTIHQTKPFDLLIRSSRHYNKMTRQGKKNLLKCMR